MDRKNEMFCVKRHTCAGPVTAAMEYSLHVTSGRIGYMQSSIEWKQLRF